jgi:plasmid stabilization system protein ParE
MDLKVTIEAEAKSALKSIYSYIKLSSEHRAKTLRRNVLNSIGELAKHPLKFPPDKFKIQNDGSIRAYEIYQLRITYSVSETQITILRIRHTKRNPVKF